MEGEGTNDAARPMLMSDDAAASRRRRIAGIDETMVSSVSVLLFAWFTCKSIDLLVGY